MWITCYQDGADQVFFWMVFHRVFRFLFVCDFIKLMKRFYILAHAVKSAGL